MDIRVGGNCKKYREIFLSLGKMIKSENCQASEILQKISDFSDLNEQTEGISATK